MQANENYDLSVKDSGSVSVISIDERRSVHQHKKDTVKFATDMILQSSVLPRNIDDSTRMMLATAGAILKAEYGLCVVAQEAYFIETGKKGNKKFTLDVSYKGLTKKKAEYEKATGDVLFLGEGNYMDEDSIKSLGLDSCRKCGSSGRNIYNGNDSGPCYNCDGAGKFDSDKVLYYEVELNSRNDGLAARDIGVKYHPMRGSSLWQPCDNIPTSRTARWVVEKNAYKDAIRRMVPVTNSGQQGSPFQMDHVEDKSTESVAVLAHQYGVEYDDLHSLADFARSCVYAAGWENEEEVISVLASLGISWRLSEIDETKYKVFGFRAGEYPIISTGALEKDDPPSGILVKNVAIDIGIDAARDAAKRLFGLEFSRSLSRDQLGEIYESVIHG